jgi:hypothetical protein
MVSFAEEGVVVGLSRLATHTRVRSGMLWYQIPMYRLSLELVGEKKPSAKTPSLEMSMSPGESGFARVGWSLDWQGELKSRRMKT